MISVILYALLIAAAAVTAHVAWWVRRTRRFAIPHDMQEWTSAKHYSTILRVTALVHDYALDALGLDMFGWRFVPSSGRERAEDELVLERAGIALPLPDRLLDADMARRCLHNDVVRCVRTRMRAGAMGRFLIKDYLARKNAVQRQLIARFYAQNTARCEATPHLDTPLCILGPNRSGTTLLYNMLASDPDARALFQWEMMLEFERPTNAATMGSDTRIAEAEKITDGIRMLVPKFPEMLRALHYYKASEIEEEVLLLFNSHMYQSQGCLLGTDTVYWRWLMRRRGKAQAYAHLRTSMQAICCESAPASHFLLKAPLHALYPQQLAAAFPGARLIVTSREPTTAVASYAKLMYTSVMHYMDADRSDIAHGRPSLEAIGRAALRQQAVMAARLAVALQPGQALADRAVVRVDFDDFVRAPVVTCQRVYRALLGREASAATVRGFEAYVAANPSGKHGRSHYSLSMFSLTERDVTDEYARALAEEQAAPGALGVTDDELLAMMEPE